MAGLSGNAQLPGRLGDRQAQGTGLIYICLAASYDEACRSRRWRGRSAVAAGSAARAACRVGGGLT
jgi:hypothetical protein